MHGELSDLRLSIMHGEFSDSRLSPNNTNTGRGFHDLEEHTLDMPQAQRKARVQFPFNTPPVELHPLKQPHHLTRAKNSACEVSSCPSSAKAYTCTRRQSCGILSTNSQASVLDVGKHMEVCINLSVHQLTFVS